ncbi:hypothetical protein [Rhizobium sp. G21]|uniref:hypothetical protein n=1 Tax=Rhizobium sp. G21 TaxID=2758439 RepID=UPI0016045B8E|nr:hypothetical protein [Rhizobium sp. G21]MBB1249053.1 hypothetical protein [Rhizobium sp. G21]
MAVAALAAFSAGADAVAACGMAAAGSALACCVGALCGGLRRKKDQTDVSSCAAG